MKRAREDWREGRRWQAVKGFVRREWPVIAFVICFALIGLGVLQVRSLGEQNRTAIRVSCQLLNRAIEQSQAAAAAPDSPTVLLVEEIVEGMTPPERRAYESAVANAPADAGPQKNTCSRVADRAYD